MVGQDWPMFLEFQGRRVCESLRMIEKYSGPRGYVRLHTGVSTTIKTDKRLLAECGAPISGILLGEATAPPSVKSARRLVDLLINRGFSPTAFLWVRMRRVQIVAEGNKAVAQYLNEVGEVHRSGRDAHHHWPRDLSFVHAMDPAAYSVWTWMERSSSSGDGGRRLPTRSIPFWSTSLSNSVGSRSPAWA